ncbi:beta-ketoacyl synthase N-terminal-like domain-containing protein [Acanthopleuribacter pedis]|uniref:Type I polyketide synthase n=1 Tax=Acanthopleuribacter pedis TaxID=442870 RepID=A0A8J7U1G2_9BACT|nr:type I polyketide synthase [Acanthopleuribacter pedis]MBO1318153.1 type I polyketide synthase [Acanthopleuribacter pedis]
MWEMNGTEVAIIGMSGRFPGAASVDAFWEMLCAGRDAFVPLSDEQSLALGADPRFLQMPAFKRVMCAMGGVDQFDPDFFDIPKSFANVMDPQQRIFLECCWEAFESAGYNPSAGGDVVGVFAAADQSSYLIFNLIPEMPRLMGEITIDDMESANSNDFVASRVSYHLNLTGPSYTIKCGCSSALVAVHNACNALLEEECDMALAGGVSILVHKLGGYLAEEKDFHAKSGRMQPFDKDASGFIRGAGGGVVLLKRLEDALSDGDNIVAVIRGSATTNDGGDKAQFSSSSVSGIAAAAIEGLAVSGAHASSLQYLEGMGLAWPTDDHIEVRALSHAFRADGALENEFCLLGSPKGNIGHLSAASGIAGLLKATCAVDRGFIPKIANLEHPDPKIDFPSTPFVPVLENQEWPESNGPRRAGVNIRGAGGTNVFMVVEQAPPQERQTQRRAAYFFPISARTPTALATIRENLATFLTEPKQRLQPADVAFTLQIGRKPFAHRMGWVATSLEELIEALRGDEAPVAFRGAHEVSESVDPVFYYGSVDESRLLAELHFIHDEPICSTMFINLWQRAGLNNDGGLGFLKRVKETNLDGLEEVDKAVAHLLACYVITDWWRFRGVTPRAVVGQGLGDLVAAAVAGAAGLPQMVALLRQCLQAGGEVGPDDLPVRFKVPELTWYSGLIGGDSGFKGIPVPEYIEHYRAGACKKDEAFAEIENAGFMYIFDVSGKDQPSGVEPALEANGLRVAHGPFTDHFILSQVAELWLAGVDVQWKQFYGEDHPHRVALPSYPFERQRCWVDRQSATRP